MKGMEMKKIMEWIVEWKWGMEWNGMDKQMEWKDQGLNGMDLKGKNRPYLGPSPMVRGEHANDADLCVQLPRQVPRVPSNVAGVVPHEVAYIQRTPALQATHAVVHAGQLHQGLALACPISAWGQG